ncbi:MAG TPA: hypothetical protein PLH18_05835, partial [Clostridia bacterium]|nr:hypothetical protein [Clostridia bacterium]
MKELHLTESEGALHGGAFKYPSRFLLEIEENMVVREGKLDPDLLEVTRRRMSGGPSSDEDDTFAAGDRVIHPVWNEGIVLDVNREKGEYAVEFKDSGIVRHIRMKYRLMVRKFG